MDVQQVFQSLTSTKLTMHTLNSLHILLYHVANPMLQVLDFLLSVINLNISHTCMSASAKTEMIQHNNNFLESHMWIICNTC